MLSALWKRRGRLCIAGLLGMLLKWRGHIEWRKCRVDLAQLVVEVADDLCTTMGIWVVEDGFQTKTHIASYHRLIETYRGYLLCSNTPGHTFLIDMRTHTYVRGSAAHLLQIDGVEHTKRFVDELCRRLQVDEGSL